MRRRSLETRLFALPAVVIALALTAAPVAAVKPTGQFVPFGCSSSYLLDGQYWPALQVGFTWSGVKVTDVTSAITTADPVDPAVLTREATFSPSSKTTSWVAYHAPLRTLAGDGSWTPTRATSYRLQAFNGKTLVWQYDWSEASSTIPSC